MMTAETAVAVPGSRDWVALWRRSPMSLRIGALILLAHLAIAVTGPFWAPYGQAQLGTGIPLSGMSWAHPLGVDQLGRDVLSRVVNGSRIVLTLSLSGTLLGLVIGAVIGLLSGYLRGLFDEVVQRLIEMIISIPFLILAMLAIAAAPTRMAGNPVLMVVVVAFVYAPRIARMARSAALEIAARDFIT